jgi:hypothetical protein
VALQPNAVVPLVNLGDLLKEMGQLDEALVFLQRAVEAQPVAAEAQVNAGQTVRFEPAVAQARCNLGLALLLAGRFAEGWPYYEWRTRCQGAAPPLVDRRRWQGEPLEGRTILLGCEQGMGDALQFVRYAPLVKQRGGIVLIDCRPALARLLATCAGVDAVVTSGAPRPPIDVWSPLPSLPAVFGTREETIPGDVPYLKPGEELVEQWRKELSGYDGLKIGIAWQGDPNNLLDHERSFPLQHFERLARLDGVRLFSLQMGVGSEQLATWAGQQPVVDFGQRLGDFYNTAAIVRNLDLVISCDSSPAHLAGSIAAPVWVALTHVPDWRWLLGRSDNPWYPTMRLFRQQRRGDWEGVFGAIEAALRERLR